MAIDGRQLGSRRQWLLLGGLVVVLAALLWLRGRGPAGTPADGARATSNRQGGPAGPSDELDVRLEALNAERAAPVDIERNPFRFEARRSNGQDDAPSVSRPAPRETNPAPPVEAGPPPAPPIPLKFIGIIESPAAGRMAALTDGRRVFHGRAGDIIEGQYRIIRIGVESIVLERVDGGTQQTIRLSGS
jgi:hypothetical protein